MEDFFVNGQAHGSVAEKLMANNMSPLALRPFIGNDGKPYVSKMIGNELKAVPVANATLRKDEWKVIDTAVIQAFKSRLIGVADLISRGLVYNIGDGLGTTVLEYQKMKDVQGATMSMNAASKGRKDRPEFDIAYLPLPIVHKEFSFDIRQLTASRKHGQPLDTTMIEMCARKCADKVEQMLFNGSGTYTFGGGTIYGYLDAPNRNTGSLTAWTASASTGATILAQVVAMKQAAIADRCYGPYVLYIPTAYETQLDEDYNSSYPKSLRQRLLEIEGISDIKVSDQMTAANVVLVQMNTETVRLVQGMGITVVEWSNDGGLTKEYKVMTISVPQVRADSEGRSGIQHWS